MADDFDIDDLRASNTNPSPPDFADPPSRQPVRGRQGRPGAVRSQPEQQRETLEQSRAIGTMLLVGIVAIIFFFCGRGCKPASHAEAPPQPAVTVTVTKTVTVTVTKTDKTIPTECLEALDLAAQMIPHVNAITTQGGQVKDIISRARIAITQEDHQGLIKAGNEMSDALKGSRASTGAIMDLQRRYEDKIADCNTALGR